MGIQVFFKKTFPRGDKYEIAKYINKIRKNNSSPEPLDQFQPNIAQSIPG